MSDSSESSAEEGEVDEHPAASPLDEQSIYGSAIAPGFMLVRGHASGKPCFQHLQTRVVTWARPYVVPHEATFEAHEPPWPLARALTTVKRQIDQNGHLQSRGTKRPLLPPAAAPTPAPAPAPSLAPASAPAPAPAQSYAHASTRVKMGGKPGEPVRMYHPGCPLFDGDIDGKTPVNVLNELCPKVYKCFPEVVTETTEDPANPFLTTIIMEGMVVARGGYSNKKTSRQIAARAALQVLCPLLPMTDPRFEIGAGATTDLGNGVWGAEESTMASMEEKEARTLSLALSTTRPATCTTRTRAATPPLRPAPRAAPPDGALWWRQVATMRLPMSDDRILENTVGKTPIMVLQEHCHKHEGELPKYTTVSHAGPKGRVVSFGVTVVVGVGAASQTLTADDTTKKMAKQRAALQMLRRLYPHVELWGELVESTNSRQREEKIEKAQARKTAAKVAVANQQHAASFLADVGPPPDAGASGSDGAGSGTAAAEPHVVHGDPGCATADAAAVAAANPHQPQPRSCGRTLASNPEVMRKMQAVFKARMWERLAELNSSAPDGSQPISIRTRPEVRREREDGELNS